MLGLLLFAGVMPAGAQEANVSHRICDGGPAEPACRGRLETAFGLYGKISTTRPYETAVNGRGTISLGYSFPVSPRDAIGLSVMGSADQETFLAVMLRFRHWLPDTLHSVEFGIGLPFDEGNGMQGGVLGLVRYHFSRWAAVSARPEVRSFHDYICNGQVCSDSYQHAAQLSLGLELTGRPGLAASTLGLLGLTALIAIIGSSFD